MWYSPRILLLFQALTLSLSGSLQRQPQNQQDEVFLEGSAANKFLSRKVLFNHWDLELIIPDNLEHECIEEVCNYEEAHEVFEDDFKTAEYGEQTVALWCSALELPMRKIKPGMGFLGKRLCLVTWDEGFLVLWKRIGLLATKNEFWDHYPHNGRGGSRQPGVDVAGLIAGLIAALVSIVMFAIVAMYCLKYRVKRRIRSRNQENGYPEVPLACLHEVPKPENAPGLPSYEQAMESSGVHDAPPPPYNRDFTDTALPT